MLDPEDSIICLLDHQSGLFQTVKDIGIAELRANTTMLAKLANLLEIPRPHVGFRTAGTQWPAHAGDPRGSAARGLCAAQGRNQCMGQRRVPEKVRESGKKTLIIAGVWTSVCVAFPALDAKAQGFNVYAVLDASGDPSEFASRITMSRLAQAGIVPTSTNAVLCEFQQHWNRANNDRFAALYGLVAPNYGAVIESYTKAQEVAKGQ